MSRSRFGVVLALLGSVALGVVNGIIFHRLFLSQVPQQWLSSFQSQTSPFTFIGTGGLLGLVIFVWSMVVAWLAPGFRGRKQEPRAATMKNP